MFKSGVFYSAALIFERSIPFVLLPVYTHVLSLYEYGVHSLVLAFIGFAVFIYSLGIENGLMIMFGKSADKQKIQATAFYGLIFTAGMISFLIIFFSSHISLMLIGTALYSHLFQIAALILFLDTFTRFFLYILIGEEKTNLYLIINILRGTFTLGLNLFFLLFLKQGLNGIYYSYGLTGFFIAVFVFFTATDKLSAKFEWKIYKQLLAYGMPLMISSLSLTLIHFMDRYFLNFLISTESTGEYSIAYKFALIVNILITSFNMTVIPRFSKAEKSEQIKILSKSLVFVSITVLLFIILSFYVPYFARVSIFGNTFVNTAFTGGFKVLPIILLGYIGLSVFSALTVPLYANKNTFIICSCIITGLLLNGILNFLLIPKYGIIGAAAATLFAFWIMPLFLCVFYKKHVLSGFNWSGLILILIPAIIIYGSVYILFPENIIFKLTATMLVVFNTMFVLFRKKILAESFNQLRILK